MNYEIKIFDEDGISLGKLNDFSQFELSRTKNDVGTLNISLPAIHYNFEDFRNDYRVEVYRNNKLIGDTCWFLKRKELSLTSGESTLVLTFADTIDILKRRVNAWFGCESPQCFGTIQATPENLLRFLAKSNFGSLVGASGEVTTDLPPDFGSISAGVVPAVEYAYRQIYGAAETDVLEKHRAIPSLIIDGYSPINIATDLNVVQEISFVEVLSAMQDVANTAFATPREDLQHNIWFDIIYSPATPITEARFEFNAWAGVRGRDLRNTKFIGPNYGNLNNAVLTEDYTNKGDIAYVLTDGAETTSVIGSAILPVETNKYFYDLPFGPTEIVTDFGQENADATVLEGEGLATLGMLNKVRTLDGNIVNTKNFDFGTDYNYGDILTMSWGDILESVEIAEITISLDGNGVETITVPLSIL